MLCTNYNSINYSTYTYTYEQLKNTRLYLPCGPYIYNCLRTKIFESPIFYIPSKMSSSYHLCVECSQLSFDSEMYTKSAADADFVYTSESNESCDKHSTQR